MKIQEFLNWEVVEKPIFYNNGNQIIEKKALVRSDNKNLLEVVNDNYFPFPNKDFLDIIQIISEKENIKESDIKLNEIQGGKRLTVMINLDFNMKVKRDTIVNKLLVQNSHGGMTSLRFGFGNMVLSCSNGLYTFKSYSDYRFRHNRMIMDNLSEALENIEIIKSRIKLFNTFSNTLADKYIQNRNELITEAIKNVTKVDLAISEDQYLNQFKDNLNLHQFKWNTANKIKEAIHLEMDNKGDSYWGLLNGFTYYTNHIANTPNRTAFLVNGYGKVVNEKAIQFIKQKLDIII